MTKTDLIEYIKNSFKDVLLEEGVGLYEAYCIDEHLSPAEPTYVNWKKKDEREDWKKLLPVLLNEGAAERIYSSAWFFMDAKGKRFHLPCFLLLDIENQLKSGNPIISGLTLNSSSLSYLAILSTDQKRAILLFLIIK